jgi:hypothetical protein
MTCCPILELRRYTLKPGRRDDLIDLFDREFVETQEAVGMTVVGQFRDLDRPDRFVWLRGFPDMSTRQRALEAFYGGPVWKAHREAANDTMIDSDDVLLLRPALPDSGLRLDERPAAGAAPAGAVAVGVLYLDAPADAALLDRFDQGLRPALTEAGATVRGVFVTEAATNTFPALPVREGEPVLVWIASFADGEARDRSFAALTGTPPWRDGLAALSSRFTHAPETLRLSPTARSRLR